MNRVAKISDDPHTGQNDWWEKHVYRSRWIFIIKSNVSNNRRLKWYLFFAASMQACNENKGWLIAVSPKSIIAAVSLVLSYRILLSWKSEWFNVAAIPKALNCQVSKTHKYDAATWNQTMNVNLVSNYVLMNMLQIINFQ